MIRNTSLRTSVTNCTELGAHLSTHTVMQLVAVHIIFLLWHHSTKLLPVERSSEWPRPTAYSGLSQNVEISAKLLMLCQSFGLSEGVYVLDILIFSTPLHVLKKIRSYSMYHIIFTGYGRI